MNTRGAFSILFFIATSGTCLSLHFSTIEKMSITDAKNSSCLNTTGHICGCDGGPAKDISVTWKPVNITPKQGLDFNIDFTLDDDLDDGYLRTKLFYQEETMPFIDTGINFTCKDFIKYLPFASCPLKKGFHIQMRKSLSTWIFRSFPGDYVGEAQVYSTAGEKQKSIICIKARIHVVEV